MNKLTKNLIFSFITLILASQSAFCYILTNSNLKDIINKEVLNQDREAILNYSSDYKINIIGIPNTDIQTNETYMPKIEVTSNNTQFSPNSYKRVLIKDSKGTIIKAFAINVQTLIYKNILVADSQIQFGEEINSKNTKLERKEVSKILDKIITQYPQGLVSKRNYQKGNIILSNSIKEKSAILKDSTIDIVFQSQKGLNIKIQGKALKEGAIGQMIPVRSNKYNKIYNAQIMSTNEVSVRI